MSSQIKMCCFNFVYYLLLARPEGIAMPPPLCFTDDFLFLTVVPLIRQRVDGSQRGLLR